MSKMSLVAIVAICLIAAGLIFGLVYDRPGSLELFFSGLALFLLGDIHAHEVSPYFREHRKVFQLMLATFSPGFSIFLLVGSLEIVFYTTLQDIWEELLISTAVGASLLAVGIVPYISWILKIRK